MAILGIGLDVVEIARIAETLERWPKFAHRCFTAAEADYCLARAFPPQHFAARFAAKEAVGKALGTGMTRWREVEVVRGRGAPTIRLHGIYAERAALLGVGAVHVTLTHSKDTAAAAAVIESAS